MGLPWDSKLRTERAGNRYVRERSDDLYHTSRWTRLSRSFRASHPLCEECKRNGVIKQAEATDHIVPWPICGRDGFFDENNLQALCNDCNNVKGQRDKARIAAWRRENALGEG